MVKRVFIWVFVFAVTALNSAHGKEVYKQTDETRDSAWNFGLTSIHHSLKSGDGVNLVGVSSVVQLGYTHISETYMVLASIDVLSGPYLATPQQAEKLDYSGTGFTVTFASSAEMANVRTHAGNYGFGIGLTYYDIVGRVVGDRVEGVSPNATTKTDSLVMRSTNFGIMPSIFFTWLAPEVRRVSNRPEDLATRIEGYYLNIGFIVPLFANYSLQYDEINEEGQSDGDVQRIRHKQKNDLFGYSIAISFTAMLGV